MKCDIGDIEIFYETYGAGRPIVMLPGQPSDHHIMMRFMEPLFTQRDGWLRIYPDLPGTGQTPSLSLATHDQMLEAMLAFIDTVIPGQRFVLAGMSYGGYMARGVVSHKADLIDGVLFCVPQVKAELLQADLPPQTTIVENPKLVVSLGPGASLIVVQNQRVVEAMSEVFAEVQIADHAFLDRVEASGLSSFDATLSIPFGGPTLILTGRQDNLCGYQNAWDLLDSYPRATFAVIDRAGHFMNIEQDVLCRSLTHEWLDRVEEATRA